MKIFIAKLQKISRKQAVDTGMAMVLLCLLAGFFLKKEYFVLSAMVLLVVNMVIPDVYRPLAVIWLSISEILGLIVSKIILSVLFFVIVTPVGIIRKLMKKDTLTLKKWKKDRSSVFIVRNRDRNPFNLEKPY